MAKQDEKPLTLKLSLIQSASNKTNTVKLEKVTCVTCIKCVYYAMY